MISRVDDFSGSESAGLDFRTAHLYDPNNQGMSVDVTTDGDTT
ncbi:hypothetical protein ABZV34_34655 [Streptomyces sp. NPDC005195]